MNSLYDLLKDVSVDGARDLQRRKKGEAIPKVVDGLKPKRPPIREGDHHFTPEELLTILVDETHVNGVVKGYQRDLDLRHSRRAAEWLRQGRQVPTLEIGMDGRGRLYFDDGQHRAAGAVIARTPVWGVIRKRTREERAELFASQRRAKKINPNTLVLAGDSPFERYVQEAVAAGSGHPWYGIVSPSSTSKSRIGPYALFQLLVRYVGNLEGQGTGTSNRPDALLNRWDRGLADELAPLIRCFGSKQTNPLAFRTFALQAIGVTTMWVFRRNDARPDDRDRWINHMPQFQFQMWPHLRTQRDLGDQLLAHWNKSLRGSRRVVRS